ncbi:MAG: hypothetical protein HXY24_12335 [Rubrivivax sp.]|jgi:hypothetical protein|nr:hypothetical protein [Rubrivivax sp.]
MARYIQFTTEDGEIFLVAVAEAEAKGTNLPISTEGEVLAALGDKVMAQGEALITAAKNSFEDALAIVKSNARAFIRQIKELPDRPDEVEMSFGLQASGELGGTFVVAKAGLEASYTITLTWKSQPK